MMLRGMAGILAFLAASAPRIRADASNSSVVDLNATVYSDIVEFNVGFPKCLKEPKTSYGWTSKLSAGHRPILLEIDNWDTAKITSNILHILLTEVLQFPVNANVYWGGFWAGPRLLGGYSDIVVEEWPTDSSQWYAQYVELEKTIYNAGLIGYTGHIGLYIPTYMVNSASYDYEFWRWLQSRAMLSKLPKSGSGPRILGSDGGPICDGVPYGCQNGTYYPPQYKPGDPNFIELWHFTPDYSANIFERLIDGLNLNVTVNYLSDSLIPSVQAKLDKNEPVFFYYWKPSSFIANTNVTRVTFPDDPTGVFEQYSTDRVHNKLTVDVPVDLMFKATSSAFQRDFSTISSIVDKFHVSDSTIVELLRLMNDKNMTERETACDWVQKNEMTWKTWIPNPPQDKTSCPYSQGLYEINGIMACVTCLSGTYNWDPNNSGSCNLCPDSAECLGGAEIRVKSGYYLADPNVSYTMTPEIYRCPYPATCCPGNNCSPSSQCASGFGGLLCTECLEPDHYIWNGQCMPCSVNSPGWSFWMILLMAFVAVFVLLLVPHKETPTVEILFFYFQVFNLIFQSSLGSIQGLGWVQSFLSFASLDIDGMVTSCPLGINDMNKQMFRFLLPLLFILYILPIYFILKLIDRSFPEMVKKFTSNRYVSWMLVDGSLELVCVRTFFIIMDFTFMPLVEAALSILDCRQIFGTRRVYKSPDVSCYHSFHINGVVLSVIILALLLVLYPLALTLILRFLKRTGRVIRSHDHELDGGSNVGVAKCDNDDSFDASNAGDFYAQVFLPLYEHFKPQYYYMGPIMLLERGAIVVFFSVILNYGDGDSSSTYSQIILFLVLCIIRVYVQPYENVFEAYLNREITVGWCLAVSTYIYMLWQGFTSVMVSALVGILIFGPPLLHILRLTFWNLLMNTSLGSMLGAQGKEIRAGKSVEGISRMFSSSSAKFASRDEVTPLSTTNLEHDSELRSPSSPPAPSTLQRNMSVRLSVTSGR